MKKYKCDNCNVQCKELKTIFKQISGETKRFEVCDKCFQEHENHLQKLRENFKAQTERW